MATEADNEILKNEVRDYWNAHPCGTQFTGMEWGSKEFFEAVERHRYEVQPFMRRVMEFDAYAGKRLLEIGCGLGTDLLQFARGGAIVSAIDLTPRSIELVKHRFELYGFPVDARVGDAEKLPFSDNSFDVVYSFGVLHHTPNTPKAVDEIYRVLKPGGRAIVMLYHRQSMHVALGRIVGKISSRYRGVATTAENWVRAYDGSDNPLGKAYSRLEVRRMFGKFRGLSLLTEDPHRRGLSPALNALNQGLFAWWWGFYLVIKALK